MYICYGLLGTLERLSIRLGGANLKSLIWFSIFRLADSTFWVRKSVFLEYCDIAFWMRWPRGLDVAEAVVFLFIIIGERASCSKTVILLTLAPACRWAGNMEPEKSWKRVEVRRLGEPKGPPSCGRSLSRLVAMRKNVVPRRFNVFCFSRASSCFAFRCLAWLLRVVDKPGSGLVTDFFWNSATRLLNLVAIACIFFSNTLNSSLRSSLTLFFFLCMYTISYCGSLVGDVSLIFSNNLSLSSASRCHICSYLAFCLSILRYCRA